MIRIKQNGTLTTTQLAEKQEKKNGVSKKKQTNENMNDAKIVYIKTLLMVLLCCVTLANI